MVTAPVLAMVMASVCVSGVELEAAAGAVLMVIVPEPPVPVPLLASMKRLEPVTFEPTRWPPRRTPLVVVATESGPSTTSWVLEMVSAVAMVFGVELEAAAGAVWRTIVPDPFVPVPFGAMMKKVAADAGTLEPAALAPRRIPFCCWVVASPLPMTMLPSPLTVRYSARVSTPDPDPPTAAVLSWIWPDPPEPVPLLASIDRVAPAMLVPTAADPRMVAADGVAPSPAPTM